MIRYLVIIISTIFWITCYLVVINEFKTIGVINSSQSNFKFIIIYGLLFNALLFHGLIHYWIPNQFKYQSLKKSLLKLLGIFLIVTIIESILDFFLIVSNNKNFDFISELLIVNFAVNFIYFVCGSMIGLFILWINNEKQKQKLEHENLKSQLNFLKNQINPHFLFNVLNTAYSTSNANKDYTTANIILELSDMLRYMLYETNQKYVSLEKEIEYIHNYISLEQKRLEYTKQSLIEFNVHIENPKIYTIAPMILIPIIENAFKHGIIESPDKKIVINLNVDHNNNLTLSVENHINISKEQTKNFGGIGLKNLRNRLELIYPKIFNINDNMVDNVYKVELNLKLI